jgi:hypothetical protein
MLKIFCTFAACFVKNNFNSIYSVLKFGAKILKNI